jgi:hypothetical protein
MSEQGLHNWSSMFALRVPATCPIALPFDLCAETCSDLKVTLRPRTRCTSWYRARPLWTTALACIDRRMPIERRVRHAMETARALSAWNRTEEALTTLLDAEKLAPEQVRHHAISRQLVQSWMRRGRGRPATNSPRSPVACTSLTDRPYSQPRDRYDDRPFTTRRDPPRRCGSAVHRQ